MRSADAGAGQHGDGQLGCHSHVDSNPVDFLYSQRLEHVSELFYFAMQLLVGKSANFSGLTLPDDCSFVLSRSLHVAIETVVRDIDLAAHEPFRPGVVPLQDFVPLLEPVQFFRDASPELFRLLDGFAVDTLVLFETLDVRLLAEMIRTLEFSLLIES